MPYVTFEVTCEKCGRLFRDASYSVDVNNAFIISKMNLYRRMDDAHWLCNPCLEGIGVSPSVTYDDGEPVDNGICWFAGCQNKSRHGESAGWFCAEHQGLAKGTAASPEGQQASHGVPVDDFGHSEGVS